MSKKEAGKRSEMTERPGRAGDGIAEGTGAEHPPLTARDEHIETKATVTIEEVLQRDNMVRAYQRVVRNGGAPGVDGITVESLMDYSREHWPHISREITEGKYIPSPVRRVEIPKSNGKGTRVLGIPTVMDRMIQQALLQVLTPVFEPTFSEWSYGFRPGRGTHDAVAAAKEHMAAGHRWVVDTDLEKFFDRVNHDVLMARVARRIKDKEILGYSVTNNKEPKLKVSPEAATRLKKKLKTIFRRGRGRNLSRMIKEELIPVIRGWTAYFKLAEVKAVFQMLDEWLRHRLRCILWRQWKKPKTRRKKLMALGLSEERASKSAYNGRGPWWNSGMTHMNQAVPNRMLEKMGLLNFLDEYRRFANPA